MQPCWKVFLQRFHFGTILSYFLALGMQNTRLSNAVLSLQTEWSQISGIKTPRINTLMYCEFRALEKDVQYVFISTYSLYESFRKLLHWFWTGMFSTSMVVTQILLERRFVFHSFETQDKDFFSSLLRNSAFSFNLMYSLKLSMNKNWF